MTEQAAVLNSPFDLQELDLQRVEHLSKRMRNPLLMGLHMFRKLPLGLVAGLRVKSLDTTTCETTVPYRWITTNPFRSTYFAAQSMAAELSTGALALMAVELAPASVTMLITGMEASFSKKATDLVTFTCHDGSKILEAVKRAVESGEPATARVETVGLMANDTEVSRFFFTWSFKKRSTRR